MFTRPMSGTADIAEQGVLLNDVSRLVDDGTLAGDFGPINATNLKRACAVIESGRARARSSWRVRHLTGQ
ncbi:hypothetical protein IGS74_00420 [Aureimonas sp. OT7]|nr:hypothetical protein IGS74_00420 [Aureimonas sp. OT7]